MPRAAAPRDQESAEAQVPPAAANPVHKHGTECSSRSVSRKGDLNAYLTATRERRGPDSALQHTGQP